MGGSGKIEFSVLLVLISFQCFFFIICLSLFASSQNCVTKTSFFLLDLGVCLDMSCCLLLNWTDSMRGRICLYLYPLCKSRIVNFCFIFLNSRSSELVLKYRLVSPLLMALIVVGGWYEVV